MISDLKRLTIEPVANYNPKKGALAWYEIKGPVSLEKLVDKFLEETVTNPFDGETTYLYDEFYMTFFHEVSETKAKDLKWLRRKLKEFMSNHESKDLTK